MFVSLLLAATPLLAPASTTVQDASAEVPRMPTAAAQLAHAGKVRAGVRGTRGAARVAALQRSLSAYQAVADYWPGSGSVLAEAAFRRGEIQRTLGRPGPATSAFQEAFDAGAGTDFRPRALLEIGHIQRRAGEYGKALATYGRVGTLEGILLRYRNDAREWTGKVQMQLGDFPKAAQAFGEWAANAESGVEILRAADLEARAWIQAGELDRARSVLERSRSGVEPLLQEPGKEGDAVRRALERMRGPELLEEALARRQARTEAAG